MADRLNPTADVSVDPSMEPDRSEPEAGSDAPSPRKITRRRFLRWSAAAAATGCAGTGLYSWLIEPRWLQVTRTKVTIEGLDSARPLRVAHLTDLHIGRNVSSDWLAGVLDTCNNLEPDLIVLTGDFVSHIDRIDDSVGDLLGRLRAPLGVFGVPGNHDYWEGLGDVRTQLRRAGIVELTNRGQVLTVHGRPLCIAGVDDFWDGRPDLSAALAGVPESVPRLVLSHNPDFADTPLKAPRVDLMLAGHTHGGQVKIPYGSRPRLPILNPAYAAGLVATPCGPMYVSVGLGMVRPPVRFNCRPELAMLELRGR